MRSWAARAVLGGALLACLAASGAAAWIAASLWPEAAVDRAALRIRPDCLFTARDGTPLRFLPDGRGERHLWVRGAEIPVRVKAAFIAAEDKRFHSHPGFDLLAIARALADNLKRGRVVSGASTISQQTARLVHPRDRSLRGKAIEILRAYRLERLLSKEEILEQYLNRVPLGKNIRGVELASRVYFGKGVRDLSAAEAALLAALPKAPGRLDPYGPHRDALFARKDLVLSRMAALGALTAAEAHEAEGTAIDLKPFAFPFAAPHVVDLLIARGVRGPGVHRTTIDPVLQREVERILASQKDRLAARDVSQAAAIVVHNPTLEVLASVGSVAYGAENGGINNGTVARRSAGSTLKPFLYAAALEAGATASTLVDDTMEVYRTPRGDYSPDNFDRREYGPVTIRVALANSLNISAVKTVEALSRDRSERFLVRAGLVRPTAAGDYGLGLAVGNAEVRLEDMAAAYAMLANGGVLRPLRYLADGGRRKAPPDRLLSEGAAYVISDILADPAARVVAFGPRREFDLPFRVSLKTGTSTRYRDGWILGYTSEYTVGVWTGNFDGSPTAGSTGAWGAAPIFGRIMEILHGHAPPPVPDSPPGLKAVRVCGISGMKAGENCLHVTRELFLAGSAPERECSFHTEGGEFHRLPVAYARWLAKKHRAGAAGRYRLRGFGDRLDGIFEGVAAPAANAIPAASAAARHSIGKPADADGLAAGLRESISILYPLPRDRFLSAGANAQGEIPLEAVPSEPVPYVDWFVDGRHVARAGPPYAASWRPERGRHRITAATSGNVADRVEITVE